MASESKIRGGSCRLDSRTSGLARICNRQLYLKDTSVIHMEQNTSEAQVHVRMEGGMHVSLALIMTCH